MVSVSIVPFLAAPEVAATVPRVVASSGFTGMVRDTTGQPVAGACLSLLRTETEVQATFCSDAQGRYAITGVPTDTGYRVRVAAPGYRTHWWPDSPDHLNAEAVYVPATDLVERQVVVGRGAGSIRGRITDESGAPAEATVSIWAADRDWRALAYVTPTGDGRYAVPNLPPGRYQAAIFDEVHGTQWVPGRDSRAEATAFSVGDGQAVVVDDRWRQLGTVEVRVADEATGGPVPRPCVEIDTTLRSVRGCGAGGLVRLDQVPPGHWQVAVTAAPSHHPPAQPLPVDVVRGQVARLTTALAPGAGVTTTVLDATTRAPVGRVCVRLVAPKWGGQSGNQGGYCSDDEGRLAIGPLTGSSTAQLYAYQPVDPHEPPAVRYGAQWVTPAGGSGDQRAASTVAIRDRRTVAIPPILLDPAGTISGVVSDALTGVPVPGVCAYPFAFRPDHGPIAGRNCSAVDGRYTIDDLGPYRWPVQFTPGAASGYAWQWSGGVADRFGASTTQVTAGGTVTVGARLVAGGTLAGAVTRGGGPAGSGYVWTHHRRTGDIAGPAAGHLLPGGRFSLPGHLSQEVYLRYEDSATTCWYARPPGPGATPIRLTAPATATVVLDLTTDCAAQPTG